MVTGEIVNNEWRSKQFEPQSASAIDLHLILDRDGLRYLIFDTQNKKIHQAGSFAVTHQDGDWLLKSLQHIKPAFELNAVFCSNASLPLATVPERFFDPAAASAYLDLAFGSASDNVRIQQLEPGKIVLVTEENNEWKRAVARVFPNVRFDNLMFHMNNFAQVMAKDSEPLMCLYTSDSFLEICLSNKDGLLFANCFETRSAEDLLYYVGLCAEEYHFDRNSNPVYLSGSQHLAFALLQKYFAKIQFPSIPASIDNSEGIENESISLFQPFFFKSLCEL